MYLRFKSVFKLKPSTSQPELVVDSAKKIRVYLSVALFKKTVLLPLTKCNIFFRAAAYAAPFYQYQCPYPDLRAVYCVNVFTICYVKNFIVI